MRGGNEVRKIEILGIELGVLHIVDILIQDVVNWYFKYVNVDQKYVRSLHLKHLEESARLIDVL